MIQSVPFYLEFFISRFSLLHGSVYNHKHLLYDYFYLTEIIQYRVRKIFTNIACNTFFWCLLALSPISLSETAYVCMLYAVLCCKWAPNAIERKAKEKAYGNIFRAILKRISSIVCSNIFGSASLRRLKMVLKVQKG